MDTFDAIYQRRAIKQFDPTHHLTKEEEDKLLEAAIQSQWARWTSQRAGTDGSDASRRACCRHPYHIRASAETILYGRGRFRPRCP